LKAELFSADFFTSVLIFSLIILMLNMFYVDLQRDVYEYNKRNNMQTRAMNIASLLATTSGEPRVWNSTNVRVVGLNDAGFFNLTKFEELKKINYQKAKIILGSGGFEVYIALKNSTGSILEDGGVQYSFGNPLTNVEQSFVSKRLGLSEVGGENIKTIMEVVIWE